MFKRLFWFGVGASFGFAGSFWVTRMVRRTVERFAPQRVSSDVTQAVRSFGQDVRSAVVDGRDAMREREATLRGELDRRPGPSVAFRSRQGVIPASSEGERRPGS
jgi:hypothetical protein